MQVFLRFICIFLRFYLVISKKSSTFAGFFKESTLKSVSRNCATGSSSAR
jgi:hypothetical protein